MSLRCLAVCVLALSASSIAGATDETGSLVVSLSANTTEVTRFQQLSVVRIKGNEDDGRPQFITNVLSPAVRDTALFIGELPPGEYRLRELDSRGRFVKLPSQALSTFRIGAGQVTDLGRLVLSAANESVLVGRSTLVESNRDLVELLLPDREGLYQYAPAHGWKSPRREDDIAEAWAVNRALGAGAFRAMPSGEVIGGARLGMVLVRAVDGNWRTAYAGELDTITAVAPYPQDGNLAVAGGELGTFVLVRGNGAIKALDRGNLPRGRFLLLDHAQEQGMWIAGVQVGLSAGFFASKKLDGGEWTPIGGIEVGPGTWGEAPQVWAWPQPGGFGFAVTSDPSISCFDYAGGDWHRGTSFGGRSLRSVLVAPDGAIGALSMAQEDQGSRFKTMETSVDCGANWTPVALPPKAAVAAPLRLLDGVISSGGGAMDDRMYVTRDDGKNWKPLTPQALLPERLWSIGNSLLGVRVRRGVEELVTSKDLGVTWKVERTTVDDRLPQGKAGAQ